MYIRNLIAYSQKTNIFLKTYIVEVSLYCVRFKIRQSKKNAVKIQILNLQLRVQGRTPFSVCAQL